MKDITGEILARTKPNLYDLVIAFLAGIAGALALCTRKSYITIVTGVAIATATAVIPPLSVAGFGIGIWNGYIAGGGFFLFLTNFVAIIFATCIVFYIYGFRPGMVTELAIIQLKKRIAFLTAIFIIISIPLIYTLHVSISQVRLRSNIQSALKREFDIEKHSRLDTFNYLKGERGKLDVSAVVNTVDYLNEEEISRIEKKMSNYLKSDVRLDVEQVKVQAGGLKAESAKSSLIPSLVPVRLPAEILGSSRESSLGTVKKVTDKIESIISPSIVEDFQIGFSYKSAPVLIVLKIKRDKALSPEETEWLQRILTTELNLPVELKVETVPFIPPLVFNKGETALSEETKTLLLEVKKAYTKDSNLDIHIESYPGSIHREELRLARERVDVILNVLIQDYRIPPDHIKTVIHKKMLKAPAVKLSINTI